MPFRQKRSLSCMLSSLTNIPIFFIVWSSFPRHSGVVAQPSFMQCEIMWSNCGVLYKYIGSCNLLIAGLNTQCSKDDYFLHSSLSFPVWASLFAGVMQIHGTFFTSANYNHKFCNSRPHKSSWLEFLKNEFVLKNLSPLFSHHSDITWASWHLKSLATWLFVKQFVQADNKGNFGAAHDWPFVRGIQRWPVDYPCKGPVIGKVFCVNTSSYHQ